MSALYTALVESESKESLAVMVCELREERTKMLAALKTAKRRLAEKNVDSVWLDEVIDIAEGAP